LSGGANNDLVDHDPVGQLDHECDGAADDFSGHGVRVDFAYSMIGSPVCRLDRDIRSHTWWQDEQSLLKPAPRERLWDKVGLLSQVAPTVDMHGDHHR
jgi:hypothetical protein